MYKMKKNNISKDRMQSIKYFMIKLSYFVFSISKNNIFVSMLNKNNITGPGRFLFNLEEGLKDYNLKITRIAQGVPAGGDLNYVDNATGKTIYKNELNILDIWLAPTKVDNAFEYSSEEE